MKDVYIMYDVPNQIHVNRKPLQIKLAQVRDNFVDRRLAKGQQFKNRLECFYRQKSELETIH